MKILVAVKGGPGSGNWGHSGRPGLVGGSSSGVSGGTPVAGGEEGRHWTSYDAPQIKLNQSELKKFLRQSGPVELWHVTLADRVDSVMKEGLIPGKLMPSGQTWKAEHSDYATYFFSSKYAAEFTASDVEELTGVRSMVIIKASYPRTEETARRMLPDEDVSLNVNNGLKSFFAGDAVAIIGGADPEHLEYIG